jgi:lysophospholipase L1-like esterase
VDFLESFTTGTAPQALYRDHIHLSAAGNAVVSEAIAAALLQQLSASPTAQLPDSLLDDPW